MDTIKGFISSGELLDPQNEQDVLEQAGRLLDKAYAHEILGEVLYVTEDGQWRVATTEVVIGQAGEAYLQDRLREFLEEAEADDPMRPAAERKLMELDAGGSN